MHARPPIAACPICGGTSFGPGPKGRSAPDGGPPRCLGCGSLERHRAMRVALAALCGAEGRDRRALQVSPDPTVDPAWFDSFEVSVFGAENSLDLAAIDRPDGAIDVVVCNHVLEHVADDRAALGELIRILSPDGWVFLSVPDPVRVVRTVEYGRAREDKYGHFRVYGPDIVERFAGIVPHALALALRDPVTGADDAGFLLARSQRAIARAGDRLRTAAIAARSLP